MPKKYPARIYRIHLDLANNYSELEKTWELCEEPDCMGTHENLYDATLDKLDLGELQEYEEDIREFRQSHRREERTLSLIDKISDKNLPRRLNRGLKAMFYDYS